MMDVQSRARPFVPDMLKASAHQLADSDAAEQWQALAGGGQWPQPCCCNTAAKAWLWEMGPAATAHHMAHLIGLHFIIH